MRKLIVLLASLCLIGTTAFAAPPTPTKWTLDGDVLVAAYFPKVGDTGVFSAYMVNLGRNLSGDPANPIIVGFGGGLGIRNANTQAATNSATNTTAKFNGALGFFVKGSKVGLNVGVMRNSDDRLGRGAYNLYASVSILGNNIAGGQP